MQPKTLSQILSELDTTYNPQIENIRQRQSTIPQGVEADIQQAGAKQTQAYEDILGGARRRGLGFSGIPLGEQAKYASTVYAPEVLRARQQGAQQALSLEDAILGINERRMSQGLQLQQAEQQRADEFRREQEAVRQFNEQLALSKRTAGGGGGGSWSPTSGTMPTQGAQGGAQPMGSAEQDAFNEVQTRVNNQSLSEFASDYRATLNSANRGNARDKLKIQFYQKLRPDVFGGSQSFGGQATTPMKNVGSTQPKLQFGGGMPQLQTGKTQQRNIYAGTY